MAKSIVAPMLMASMLLLSRFSVAPVHSLSNAATSETRWTVDPTYGQSGYVLEAPTLKVFSFNWFNAIRRFDDQVWVFVEYSYFMGRALEYHRELLLFDAQGVLKQRFLDQYVPLNAVQSDGRLIVANLNTGGLQRLDASGSPDSSFYPNGANDLQIGVYGIIQNGSVAMQAKQVVQADDKILLLDVQSDTLKLGRLNVDGTVDTSLSPTTTITTTSIDGVDPTGRVIASLYNPFTLRCDARVYSLSGVQLGTLPNGMGVCATSSYRTPIISDSSGGFTMAYGGSIFMRTNATYGLDLSFGISGTLEIPHQPGYTNAVADFTVLPDRSIIASISSIYMNNYPKYPYIPAVGKWHADGTPDSAFGPQGYFLLNQRLNTTFLKVLPLSTGKFLLAGIDAQGNVVLTCIAPFTVQGKVFLSAVSK